MDYIFLSYAGTDRDVATRIKDGLVKAGVPLWQDVDQIHLGDRWLEKLQEALKQCSGYAILIGSGGIQNWVNAELGYALKRHYDSNTSFPIYPLLLPGKEPENLPPFLSEVQAERLPLEPTQADYARLAKWIRAKLDAPKMEPVATITSDVCPFSGLESYDEDNALFYCGRDSRILEALELLGRSRDGTYRNWLQVEGASGVGKSSLVKAGMLPAIRRGWIKGQGADTPLDWKIAIMRPGCDPVLNLAEVLTRTFQGLAEGRLRLGDLKRELNSEDSEVLRDFIRQHVPARSRFLLVVDQFEEVFTLAEATTRERFDTLLAVTLEDHENAFHLITTIRSDFTLRLNELPKLESQIHRRAERYYLKPIGEDGLRDAVCSPAQLAGLEWSEPTLPDRIVADALREPSALPLVSNLLLLLWQGREGNRLLARVYEDLGGVGGALAQSADKLLQELGRDGRERTRKLLLRLVKISHDSQPVRRTISRSTALRAAGGGPEGEHVLSCLSGGVDRDKLQELAGARLIVISNRKTDESVVPESLVDLAHEALLTQWDTLRNWIRDYREQLYAEEALEDAAQQWNEVNKPRLPGIPNRSQYKRYSRASAPSELALEYFRAVRFQLTIRIGVYSLVALGMIATTAFGWWSNREGLSVRAGMYLLLASADLYYLRPEMVKVSEGKFVMGSPAPIPMDSENSVDSCEFLNNEFPQHEVILDEAFYIGRYEVTFDEYDIFARLSGKVEIPSDSGWGRGRRPVVNVSWDDAVAYADWLSEKTGKSYRLPTESEWEYVARGGSTTVYWWGEFEDFRRVAGSEESGIVNCWECESTFEGKNLGKRTASVGSFPANEFGLYDTAGNVWEWVQDCWHRSYEGAPKDGSGWENPQCTRRITRGGAWNSDRCQVRSAYRGWGSGTPFEAGGFRVVRNLYPGE